MAVTPDYLQYVLEQLGGLAHVSSRRMFGGIGLYCDGVFFGLIDNDTLFFKVDDSNRPDYVARGMAAFRPFPDRPDQSTSYFEVPADALEDRDELAVWARKSVLAASAKRTDAVKKSPKKPQKPSIGGRLKRPTRRS
jgi:DNA transformation protein